MESLLSTNGEESALGKDSRALHIVEYGIIYNSCRFTYVHHGFEMMIHTY